MMTNIAFMELCFISFATAFYNNHVFISPYDFTNKQRLNTKIKVTSDIREQLTVPPSFILDVIDKVPSKRLTIPDAAALAGTDLQKARKAVILLAGLVGANMDVTKNGDIVYTFPTDFKRILFERSLGQRIQKISEVVLPPLLFLGRISFGLFLLTSLAVIFSTFILVSTSSGNGNNDDSDRKSNERRDSNNYANSYYSSGGGGFGFNFNPFTSLSYDYLFYGPRPGAQHKQLNFLEVFFSYVFGDGDPNEGFLNNQLQECASIIRSNGGVVFAEQLAVFLNPPTPPSNFNEQESSTLVNEQWMLPVVSKLNGVPSVTEDGDIVYYFPELTPTVLPEAVGRSGGALSEQEVQLCRATGGSLLAAGGLGVLNLVGATWLGSVLSNPLYLVKFPQIALLAKAYPLLLAYAVLYNAIPLARWLLIQRQNKDIRERNENRRLWERRWKNVQNDRVPKLAKALKGIVREGGIAVDGRITDSDIVYSTSKDMSEIAESQSLEDFDKKLKM